MLIYIYIYISVSVIQIYSTITYAVRIFISSSGAERNVTVQWYGRFGCLSFCFCYTAITLCGRIKIIKVDGW